jgi:hypothetical protein
MTQDVAVLAAGLAGFALTAWLTRAELDAWGWRAAFLIGTAVVPVGLYMRRNLPETMHDDLTGSPLAPAWYMTGAVLIGGIAMTLMKETAPVKVGLAPGH